MRRFLLGCVGCLAPPATADDSGAAGGSSSGGGGGGSGSTRCGSVLPLAKDSGPAGAAAGRPVVVASSCSQVPAVIMVAAPQRPAAAVMPSAFARPEAQLHLGGGGALAPAPSAGGSSPRSSAGRVAAAGSPPPSRPRLLAGFGSGGPASGASGRWQQVRHEGSLASLPSEAAAAGEYVGLPAWLPRLAGCAASDRHAPLPASG
jgi:hypothetical protein